MSINEYSVLSVQPNNIYSNKNQKVKALSKFLIIDFAQGFFIYLKLDIISYLVYYVHHALEVMALAPYL